MDVQSSCSLSPSIAPHPSRADHTTTLQVSTNWAAGRSTLFPLLSSPRKLYCVASPTASSSLAAAAPAFNPPSHRPFTLVALAGPIIFSASRALHSGLSIPSVEIHLATDFEGRTGQQPLLSFKSETLSKERKSGWLKGDVAVVDLTVDSAGWQEDDEGDIEGARSIRVYVAFSSGAWSIFTISKSSALVPLSIASLVVAESFSRPSPTVPPLALATLSTLHSSLLVTCTPTFNLAFYDVSTSFPSSVSSSARLIKPFQSFKSHTSWWPAALTSHSRPSDHRSSTKITLAYSVPVYPSDFSVAIQEMTFDLRPTGWSLASERGLSALTSGFSPEDDAGGLSAPGTSVVVGRVASLAVDERWVCLGGEDNRIQVFEIPKEEEQEAFGTGGGRMVLGKPQRLRHVQTLFQHGSAVTSIACLDGQLSIILFSLDSASATDLVPSGRCVSADSSGTILIWDLDRPSGSSSPISPSPEQISSFSNSPSSAWPPPPHTIPPPVSLLTPAKRRLRARRTLSFWADAAREEDGEEETGAGRERIVWVGQDQERVVSVNSVKRALTGLVEDDEQEQEEVKVWSFDS